MLETIVKARIGTSSTCTAKFCKPSGTRKTKKARASDAYEVQRQAKAECIAMVQGRAHADFFVKPLTEWSDKIMAQDDAPR